MGDNVDSTLRGKQVQYTLHQTVADDIVDKVAAYTARNPEYRPSPEVIGLVAFHRLASLFAGANWSSKIAPEAPCKSC